MKALYKKFKKIIESGEDRSESSGFEFDTCAKDKSQQYSTIVHDSDEVRYGTNVSKNTSDFYTSNRSSLY